MLLVRTLVANLASWRLSQRRVLVALMCLAIAGTTVGLAFHPKPSIQARATIVLGSAQPAARATRDADAAVLAEMAKWPGIVDDARETVSSDRSDAQIRAGLSASATSNGSVEIETSGPTYPSAAAVANALAARLTLLGRIARVHAGTGRLALADFGIGAFSAPPKRITLLHNAGTYRPAIEVVCTTAVGCGAGSTITYPFQAGHTYTVTAWVRSLAAAPSRLIVAAGHNAHDVRTNLPQVVHRRWTRLLVSWKPAADLGSTSVTVQTAAHAAVDFQIGEVTIANTGKPRAPLFGTLHPATIQPLLDSVREAKIVPASPVGDTSTATAMWAALALACGLLASVCAVLLRRLNRSRQPREPTRSPWRGVPLRVRAIGAAIAGLVFVGVPLVAATRYPGTTFPFLLFQISYTLLLLLVLPRPRRYAYTALAVLLFLGFWMKFNLHAIFDYAFQEPTGGFDGSPKSWDTVMVVASAAAAGAVISRLAQVVWARRRDPTRAATPLPITRRSFRTPEWYLSHRRSLWFCTAVGGIALAGANAAGAFYAIGVDPRVILPFHLNVLAGWAVDLGVALWIAVLVHWEDMAHDGSPGQALIAPIVEAPVATISALSRGIYLFHLLPYGLVFLEDWHRLRSALSRRRLAALAALVVIGFIVSLAVSSALRLAEYPRAPPGATGSVRVLSAQRETRGRSHASAELAGTPPAGVIGLTVATSRFGATRVNFMVHQVFTLFTDRWTGLEAVMAVSAYEKDGWGLFTSELRESPGVGQRAKYQLISGSNHVYASYAGFTFLSLPGVVGILSFSGSLVVVLLGMALVTSVLLGLERLTLYFTGNPYLAAVSGVAMANELCEASFPYLLGIFFVLLTVSLACIAAVYEWQARPSTVPA